MSNERVRRCIGDLIWDCDTTLMGQVADRVVMFSELRGLASILTELTLRT